MIRRLSLLFAVLWACSAAGRVSAYGQQVVVGATAQAPSAPQPKPPSAGPAARVSRQPGRPRSWEFSASLMGFSPSGLGATTATLTPNQTGSTTPTTYFTTSSRLQTTPGVGLRLGFVVTRGVVVEGGMTYSKPGVRLTVGSDVEGAAAFTSIAERLSEYSFDAGARVHLAGLTFHRGRGRPFVAASAGYLRQLHEGRTVVDSGIVYGAGGGVMYLLRARRVGIFPGVAIQGISLRTDLRWTVAARGYSFDGRAHGCAAVGAGLHVGF
jgi:hypothetical protein